MLGGFYQAAVHADQFAIEQDIAGVKQRYYAFLAEPGLPLLS